MSNQRNVALWTRPAWSTDRFVRDLFGPAAASDWLKQVETRPTGLNPAAEVVKDGDDAVIRLELPGVDINTDVHVDVEDGRLVVHGERRDEFAPPEGEDDGTPRATRVLNEIRYGVFRRSFALPEHIGGDDVTASYHAGVLTVRVVGAHRKPETPGAQRIRIENN